MAGEGDGTVGGVVGGAAGSVGSRMVGDGGYVAGHGGYVAGHGGYMAAGAVVDGTAAAAAPAQVPAMAEQVATLRGHTDAVRALTL
jgi:hypothetical protein